MSKWTKQKLGDVALIVDCSHSTPCWTEYGIFTVRNFNLSKGRINKDKSSFVSEETFIERTRRAKPQKGDIILSREAPIGSVGLINTEEKMCLGQRVVLIRPEKVESRFLLYQLISSSVQDQFKQSNGTGSTVSNLRIPLIKNTNLNLPDLPTQKRIASVLSAYDDLIENNERRIKVLEEMAQMLYTEWFVKFKFPGHEKVKLIDSKTEYGKIPENFILEDITNFVKFERGIEPGSAKYKTTFASGLVPFLRVGDLGSRYSELYIEKSDAKGKFLERKDIAITMDGTVGRVIMGLSGAYSTGIRKLVIIDKRINREFLFIFMLSDYIQNLIKSHARGSTILHASESIKYMKILLPNLNLMNDFEKNIKPVFNQILNLQVRNRFLVQTRDLLIPQLVTGKRELK